MIGGGTTLLILAALLPFAVALVAPILVHYLHGRAGYLLWPAFVPAILLLPAGWSGALQGKPITGAFTWSNVLGLEVAFRGDGFSLLFAGLIGIIGTLILLFSAAYLSPTYKNGRFYSQLLVFGGAMLGIVLTDNLIALFTFWEITTVSSFLLIGFWDFKEESRAGAVKALLVTGFGGLALLAATVLLGIGGGSWTISELNVAALTASPYFVPGTVLLLLAAFTKSAQIPFHLWLPTAMEAPTPVSAFLHSATMVKAGVVLVAKFGWLFTGTAFAPVVLVVGLATMLWGGYLALQQYDLKALLAYSTISQLGILIALYGIGAVEAATAHLVNHAAFKATLFLVVGIIEHQTGRRDLRTLAGLLKKMPATSVFGIVAALSMAGLPPFGGFISKELFIEAIVPYGVFGMATVVIGGAITFAYSFRFMGVFFGHLPRKRELRHPSLPLFAPLVPLVLAILAFGFVPLTNPLINHVTELGIAGFTGASTNLALWHGVNLALGLSVLSWVLGIALHLGRNRVNNWQARIMPRWNANTVFYASLNGLAKVAGQFTRFSQGASFGTQLRIMLAAAGLIGLGGAWRYMPSDLSPVNIELILIAVLILASTVGVLFAKDRLTALVFVALSGFAVSLVFVVMNAPDLAITQLLIEGVTVILFLSVFRYLPKLRRYARKGRTVVTDAIIASSVGLLVFGLLIAVQTPIAPRLKEFFLEHSRSIGGGFNVVNVLLVDFRGYDTMGEIAVFATAAVVIVGLLKLPRLIREAKHEQQEEGEEHA